MEWIKVEDRLPNIDESRQDITAIFIGWDNLPFQRTLEYDFEYKKWYDWNGNWYNTVTHWKIVDYPKD